MLQRDAVVSLLLVPAAAQLAIYTFDVLPDLTQRVHNQASPLYRLTKPTVGVVTSRANLQCSMHITQFPMTIRVFPSGDQDGFLT